MGTLRLIIRLIIRLVKDYPNGRFQPPFGDTTHNKLIVELFTTFCSAIEW
jgi:hypothetical protein